MASIKVKNPIKRGNWKVKSVRKHIRFPSNYRIIPERFKEDGVAFFVGSFLILIAIFAVTLDLFLNLKEQKRLTDEKVKLIKEQIFWEKEITDKPDFRDAYFGLAIVDYRLNDFGGAIKNVEKSLEIDPSFKEGTVLKEKLENR
jgi:hypothetical protein